LRISAIAGEAVAKRITAVTPAPKIAGFLTFDWSFI
jgi:hypothetical protein